MPNLKLGKTLVIANPASHSGRGKQAALHVSRFFKSYASISSSFEMVFTKAPLDAVDIAKDTVSYDSVVVLGGDGVLHEVVNGLMTIPADARPSLALIPMGSGNDYARTISQTFNKPEAALAEIFAGHHAHMDLGRVVNETGECSYFVQTLSFGLDAAASHDTTIRRAQNDTQEGEGLFLTSGFKMLASGSAGFPSTIAIDDGERLDLPTIVLVCNIGPTYGGGIKICPDASPVDGELSLCFNTKKPSIPHLLYLFGRAYSGKHTRSSIITTRNAKRVDVSFAADDTPCQVDGEVFSGASFTIDVLPRELDVIVPARCSF